MLFNAKITAITISVATIKEVCLNRRLDANENKGNK